MSHFQLHANFAGGCLMSQVPGNLLPLQTYFEGSIVALQPHAGRTLYAAHMWSMTSGLMCSGE